MKKILCIGNVCYDITFPMKKYPVENTKNKVSKIVEGGGGTASNCAYLLGKWNLKPYFMGIVGNDIYGDKIKKEFNDAKVNIEYLETSKKIGTKISSVIACKYNESRTTITNKNSKMKLSSSSIDFEPDIILVDGEEPAVSLEIINKYKNAISIIDAGVCNEHTIELCKHVDYIIASSDFVQKLTGIKFNYKNLNSFGAIFQMLYDFFPNKKYVITIGEKGSMFLDDDTVKNMPTYRMNVKDTTGAGDIFHGAFIYGLTKNYTLEECVKLGNIAGSLSTRKVGARASVPKLKEVMSLYGK